MDDFVLELAHQHRTLNPSRPIFLIAVFRDEALLLPHFVDYYQRIGVTDFIFIDNLSTDSGPQYLKQRRDINITLYHAAGSYKNAGHGIAWINLCLKNHCQGSYTFVVDIDELILFDSQKYNSISSVISDMEENQSNVFSTVLLDMYPKTLNNDYQSGMTFLQHSNYFDRWDPCSYLSSTEKFYEKVHYKTGGARLRALGTQACLLKFSFFKYNFSPIGLNAGYHFFRLDGKVINSHPQLKVMPLPQVLFHFKFIKPYLLDFLTTRIKNNQDFDDSSEYRAYFNMLNEMTDPSLYDSNVSEKLTSTKQLAPFYAWQ